MMELNPHLQKHESQSKNVTPQMNVSCLAFLATDFVAAGLAVDDAGRFNVPWVD